MPFPSALTSPDYTKLRAGGHKSNQYLLLGSNTTVFAARVNQPATTTSIGGIEYNTVTVGAYTDILEGMTVLVSATNDKAAAYFVGRIRANNSGVVSSSTAILINETSAAIDAGDYIFVIRDYRLFHELGRYAGGTYYKDYGRTFSALKPVIYGLQSAYAGIVSGSPLGFTVSFAASALATTAGATISSYAYTLPSGATATAGSISTANVTVRFDDSATEYWVKLVVTDSGGRTQTRYIPVFAIPADLSTTIYLGAEGADITGDIDNGYNATVPVFAGFSSVLDNTLAVVFDVEYYGSTQTSLLSAVKFVGRIRTDTNATQANDKISASHKATVEIEGVAAQLARITSPLITMRDSSAASVWDEITQLTVWRSVVYLLEHSTFHNLHSLSFDSPTNTFYAYQLAPPQGNLFNAANDLLKSINTALEFAPTGEVQAMRNVNFYQGVARDAVPTVAAFDSQDWIDFNLEHQHTDTIGLVEASGATYARGGGILASMVLPVLSAAPGTAQGNAEGTSPLPGQILATPQSRSVANIELNQRAGDHYAFANGGDELTVTMRTGYNWITPERQKWYTFTIAASDKTFGRAYTTADRWWCKSVSIRHDNASGKKDVQAVFVHETSGADAGAVGQAVPIPAPQTTPPTLPGIPPVTPYPNDPTPPPIYLPDNPTPPQLPPMPPIPGTPLGIPVDGNAVVYWSRSHIWMVRNFLGLNTPTDITPDDLLGEIQDFALVGQGGYLVTSDGTNSEVRYLGNVFTMGNTWANSGAISGIYSIAAPTSTEGDVYAYGETGSSTTLSFDFTIDDQGWDLGVSGVYTAGVGWQCTNDVTVVDSGHTYYYRFVQISYDLGASHTVTRVAVTFDYVGADNLYPQELTKQRIWHTDATAPNRLEEFDIVEGSGTQTIEWTGTISDSIIGTEITNSVTFDTTFGSGQSTITAIEIDYTDLSSSKTAYSTDHGATFATPVSVGTPPAGGGSIDTIKIGVPVITGADGQVRIATSAGGAYSDYGSATPTGVQPTALVLPRYQFGSTSSGNVTTTTPQYLIGSGVLGSSNKAVLKVTASGVTFTDITPSNGGDYGLVINHRSLAMPWWSGSRIAGVLMFGSSPRLVVSTNAGGAWTDRGILDDDAVMVTYRKGDRTMTQLFLTNGGPAYSPDHGATIVTKSYPADSATEPIIGIAVYG